MKIQLVPGRRYNSGNGSVVDLEGAAHRGYCQVPAQVGSCRILDSELSR